MGYYYNHSQCEITWKGKPINMYQLREMVSRVQNGFYEEKYEESVQFASILLGEYPDENSYECQADMATLSMVFPQFLFQVHIEGSDASGEDKTYWYFKNGNVKACSIILDYQSYESQNWTKFHFKGVTDGE